MTNFDIFAADPQFEPFASVAVSAERILQIEPSACVINCRRAMEFAIKWMYSVDKALVMPYQDTLVSLMNGEDFRDIVGTDLWKRMDLIRRMGNNAAHTGKKDYPGSGGAVSGKSVCVSGLCGLLLRRELHGAAF